MRGYPVLKVLACLMVLLVVGCSGGKIAQISTPSVDAPGKWWANKDISTPSRAAKPDNRETTSSDAKYNTHPTVTGSILSNKAYIEVENRIASNREAWDEYCANVGKLSGGKGNVDRLVDQSIKPTKPVSAGVDQLDIDRVNRKYSAELFNARLKISLLEERLTTADTDRQKLLNEKLDEAKAQLAYVENACKAEIDGRVPVPIGGRPFVMENIVPMTE